MNKPTGPEIIAYLRAAGYTAAIEAAPLCTAMHYLVTPKECHVFVLVSEPDIAVRIDPSLWCVGVRYQATMLAEFATAHDISLTGRITTNEDGEATGYTFVALGPAATALCKKHGAAIPTYVKKWTDEHNGVTKGMMKAYDRYLNGLAEELGITNA